MRMHSIRKSFASEIEGLYSKPLGGGGSADEELRRREREETQRMHQAEVDRMLDRLDDVLATLNERSIN